MRTLCLAGVVLCLGIGVALAQAPAPAAAAAPAVTVVTATNAPAVEGAVVAEVIVEEDVAQEQTRMDIFVHTLKQGGKTMIFLALLSVLGLATAIERAINLRKSRIVPDGFSTQALVLWGKGKFDELQKLCEQNKSILADVVITMIEQRDNPDVLQVKMFAEDKASRELRLEVRRAHMLSVVATISPLLGLFGTVVGLLGAFSTVAALGDMGDPAAMADDIGKALVTTVAGLIIAMPALFMHHHFRSRINLYGVMLEEEVSALINAWFVKKG